MSAAPALLLQRNLRTRARVFLLHSETFGSQKHPRQSQIKPVQDNIPQYYTLTLRQPGSQAKQMPIKKGSALASKRIERIERIVWLPPTAVAER